MEVLRDWLIQIGWSQGWATTASIAAAVVISYLVGWGLRGLAKAPVSRSLKSSQAWREAISRWRVVPRTARVAVIVMASYLVLPLLEPWPQLELWTDRLFDGLLVLAIAAVTSAWTSAMVDVFGQRDAHEQRLPFKALGQSLQIAIWTYAGVALLTVITGQNVTTVLTGLTAVGAVLVYVFRDPILGWTAGVQLAANDLVRIGDVITVRQRDISGTVEEIALTTVKVRNWDKTISTIPTYALFSESFLNWRGMLESGVRRIKRSIPVDTGSVRFCDAALLDRLRQSPLAVKAFESTDEGEAPTAGSDPLSDPRPTNLGCFRAWLHEWLVAHPKTHNEMITVVREREQAGRGIPVEVLVFCTEPRWEHYERLQAEMFDHIVSVLPEFDLKLFQEPTGEDLRVSAADN